MKKSGRRTCVRQPLRSPSPLFVAIVGGSASGKTWLSEKIRAAFPGRVISLSLDSFYRDRSHLPPDRRARINFDHPASIDWNLFFRVLTDCLYFRETRIPVYDFKTHCRLSKSRIFKPKQIILVDGLWLLHRQSIRNFFALRIFLECPVRKRLQRRIARDSATRGRTDASVREQFRRTVEPMHKKFVLPQRQWADAVLRGNWGEREVKRLVQRVVSSENESNSLRRSGSGFSRRRHLRQS